MAQDVLELQADRLLEQAGRYDLTSRAIRRQDRLWRRRTVDLDGLAVAAQVTEAICDCSRRTVTAMARRVRATERELDCLRLLCEDHSQADIAAIIGWSQRTVCDDLQAILGRLGPLVGSYPYFGLSEILDRLMTLRTNWPRHH